MSIFPRSDDLHSKFRVAESKISEVFIRHRDQLGHRKSETMAAAWDGVCSDADRVWPINYIPRPRELVVFVSLTCQQLNLL